MPRKITVVFDDHEADALDERGAELGRNMSATIRTGLRIARYIPTPAGPRRSEPGRKASARP